MATTPITLMLPSATLQADLVLPEKTPGLVIFVHGSGSSRFSRRNQAVAAHFSHLGLGSLLFDLLTEEEYAVDQLSREYRFNIPLLSRRLEEALHWLRQQPDTSACHYGLFGASTGAAAALIVAARQPDQVSAVVSRGGRTDLAGEYQSRVLAPTLLIVGSLDPGVLSLNEETAKRLTCEHRLSIVSEASHLFEEPGKLEQVATLAGDWFARFLTGENR